MCSSGKYALLIWDHTIFLGAVCLIACIKNKMSHVYELFSTNKLKIWTTEIQWLSKDSSKSKNCICFAFIYELQLYFRDVFVVVSYMHLESRDCFLFESAYYYYTFRVFIMKTALDKEAEVK